MIAQKDGSIRLSPQFARCIVAYARLDQKVIDESARYLKSLVLGL
jgi:hypothetical protein